jgi:alpha-D-xyloside xylohydrolase
MPLYVRAGAIIPMGPLVQSTAQPTDGALTLNVYTGSDGKFDLYEDDGLSYAYERNQFIRIPITYDEATGTLSIGKRQGSYPGMFATRTLNLRFITPGRADVANFDAIDQSVEYTGQAISLKRS